jgi:hypothetical protein
MKECSLRVPGIVLVCSTEFVKKSSASHTLQCYSNRNELLEHYPWPTDRVETES